MGQIGQKSAASLLNVRPCPGMSACFAFERSHARNSSSLAALSSYETVLDAPHDSHRHLWEPADVLPFLRIADPQHWHITLFIEPSRRRGLTARFSAIHLRGRRS